MLKMIHQFDSLEMLSFLLLLESCLLHGLGSRLGLLLKDSGVY
jgi:hypothetical protein